MGSDPGDERFPDKSDNAINPSGRLTPWRSSTSSEAIVVSAFTKAELSRRRVGGVVGLLLQPDEARMQKPLDRGRTTKGKWT